MEAYGAPGLARNAKLPFAGGLKALAAKAGEHVASCAPHASRVEYLPIVAPEYTARVLGYPRVPESLKHQPVSLATPSSTPVDAYICGRAHEVCLLAWLRPEIYPRIGSGLTG
jgi:hypothetical protein